MRASEAALVTPHESTLLGDPGDWIAPHPVWKLHIVVQRQTY